MNSKVNFLNLSFSLQTFVTVLTLGTAFGLGAFCKTVKANDSIQVTDFDTAVQAYNTAKMPNASDLVGGFGGTCYLSNMEMFNEKLFDKSFVNPSGYWLLGKLESSGSLKVSGFDVRDETSDFTLPAIYYYDPKNYEQFRTELWKKLDDSQDIAIQKNGEWIITYNEEIPGYLDDAPLWGFRKYNGNIIHAGYFDSDPKYGGNSIAFICYYLKRFE